MEISKNITHFNHEKYTYKSTISIILFLMNIHSYKYNSINIDFN